MPDMKNTTRAQTLFLRAFRQDPAGPPANEWPSPVVLRRWLKRPGFCGAMNSILRAMRYKADFHLTAAAASGANLLHGAVLGGDPSEARKHIESLIHLLRMNHIRQRFAEPLPQAPPTDRDLIEVLRTAHPSITVEDALRCIDVLGSSDRDPDEEPIGRAIWKKTGHPFSKRWDDGSDPTDPPDDEDEEDPGK
jgi:hypothetical protein